MQEWLAIALNTHYLIHFLPPPLLLAQPKVRV